jgi:hypothetical protein
MDEWRPWMWRSHRNTSILILTCLIQRSDESQMSSLISTVWCFRFSPLENCIDTCLQTYLSPDPPSLSLCTATLCLFLLLKSKTSSGSSPCATAAQPGGEVSPSEISSPFCPLLPCLLILSPSWCSARQEEKGEWDWDQVREGLISLGGAPSDGG